MDKDVKDTLISDLQEIVQFEKKKLILPILLVIVLTSSVIYGLELRDNQELDEEILDQRLGLTEIGVLNIESDYYPNESGIGTGEDLREASEEVWDNANQNSEILRAEFVAAVPSIYAIESWLIPLTPSSMAGMGFSNGNSGLLFRLKDGYVVSKEPFEVFSEIEYRQRKLNELEQKVNNSNISYEEFQQRVEKINSVEYEDQELRDYVFADNNSLEYGIQLRGSRVSSSDISEELKKDNLREIQFYHFIPSLFATFITYYLFSGLILTGLRNFKTDIEEFSKKDSFFRNNLILSATASTGTALLFQTVLWSTNSPSSIFIAMAQLMASSIFWLSLFAVTANELRKFTRYAWILTGIGLNLLIIPISIFIGYNQRFLLDTFVIGATVFYPFLLGIFSEYGRIHGEKYLKKLVSNQKMN